MKTGAHTHTCPHSHLTAAFAPWVFSSRLRNSDTFPCSFFLFLFPVFCLLLPCFKTWQWDRRSSERERNTLSHDAVSHEASAYSSVPVLTWQDKSICLVCTTLFPLHRLMSHYSSSLIPHHVHAQAVEPLHVLTKQKPKRQFWHYTDYRFGKFKVGGQLSPAALPVAELQEPACGHTTWMDVTFGLVTTTVTNRDFSPSIALRSQVGSSEIHICEGWTLSLYVCIYGERSQLFWKK